MKVALALTVLALAVAGCGSEDEGDASNEGTRVAVTAVDFAFEPATVELDEGGSVTLALTNEGEFPHALTLEDGMGTDTIDPGGSTEVSLDLEPGTYTIYCPVGDHRERGMEGTLTVGGAMGAGAGGGEDDSKPADDSGYGYG